VKGSEGEKEIKVFIIFSNIPPEEMSKMRARAAEGGEIRVCSSPPGNRGSARESKCALRHLLTSPLSTTYFERLAGEKQEYKEQKH
jgi:hypothetical protein